MSRISVFMADGSEEVECLAVVDVARRAGIEVQTVSVTGRPEITSSHGVRIAADVLFEDAEFESSDILYLPGGMPGTENLYAHQGLCELVRRFAAEGKRVAALCAAPSVLGRQGVVTDGNITTGRGVGFAIDMGLELVRLLKGDDFAADLRRRVQYPGC